MISSIDLRPYKQPITGFLSDSVARFAAEHSDDSVSALGLFYAGLNPYLYLSFDTKDHSDAYVAKYQHEGDDWYGKDKAGSFCNNPPDFAFQFAEFDFADFPDLYEVNPAITLTDFNGAVHNVHLEDDGDEAVNEIMFHCFLTILESFHGYTKLTRDPVFRLGLRMNASAFDKFWTP